MITKTKLSYEDINFIKLEVKLKKILRGKLEKYIEDNSYLQEVDIIDLDDYIADQLCIDGFDLNDQPTSKGLKLEDLRDKLTAMLNENNK